VCEDLPGAGRIESQVADPELQRVFSSPKPRQMRLLGTASGDQLRSPGNRRDHQAEHIVAGR